MKWSLSLHWGTIWSLRTEPDRRKSARVEEWRLALCRLVCAGAGARGRCVCSLLSSISFLEEVKWGVSK
jgi:hypothetical protein